MRMIAIPFSELDLNMEYLYYAILSNSFAIEEIDRGVVTLSKDSFVLYLCSIVSSYVKAGYKCDGCGCCINPDNVSVRKTEYFEEGRDRVELHVLLKCFCPCHNEEEDEGERGECLKDERFCEDYIPF